LRKTAQFFVNNLKKGRIDFAVQTKDEAGVEIEISRRNLALRRVSRLSFVVSFAAWANRSRPLRAEREADDKGPILIFVP
jgi:hypothetical protein